VTVNPYCSSCPDCGSNLIDQEHFDRGLEKTLYHCVNCGVWYDEEGGLDE